MNELQKYVDMLFKQQRQTAEVKDLKEEVLSNMAAKRADFINQGFDEDTATQKAKESLVCVEGLIDGTQLTYIDKYHTECLQTSLLNSVIFWICTLPLLLTNYAPFSSCGLWATVAFGIAYIIKLRHQSNAIAFVSVPASEKRSKLAWIIWLLFFFVCIVTAAAITFGSTIWFGRQLNISGPYQFFNVAIRFYVPLLTIVIPITMSQLTKRLIENEKRDENE